MITKKDNYGWVSRGKEAHSSQLLNDAPTKVVAVDWPNEESPGKGQVEVGGDATVLANIQEDTNSTSNRRSAQYIPVSGMRKTGEITTLWLPKKSLNLQSVLEIMKSPVRSRLALLVLIPCIIFFGAFYMLTSYSKDPSKLSKTPSELPIPAQFTALGTKKATGNPVKAAHSSRGLRPLNLTPPTDIQPSPNLKDASDALVEGRLNDALAVYQKLMLAFPEDESFELAVEILSRRRGVDRDE